MLPDNVFDDRLHESLLKVKRCLDARKGKPQQTVTDCLRQPGSDTLHQHIELTIIQQIVECLPHLLRLIRPDLIELF